MEAVFHLSECVRLDPKYAQGHNNLGEAYRQRGELEPAVRSFEAAIALNKGFKQAHNNLGLCYRMRSGDMGKEGATEDEVARQAAVDGTLAQRCFSEAVAIDPSYTAARFHLATSCAERGRPEEACKQLREVLKQDSK
jgi:Flp pilus assembly protein TadD